MKFLGTGLMIAATALTAVAQDKLPTAAEVFDKYVAAAGGKAAIEKVTSRVLKGTIDVVSFGASGTFEQDTKAPNKLINISTIPGYGDVIQAYDGKAGWASMPDSGLRDMEGAELQAYKEMADFHRELKMKDDPQAKVTGKSKVGEREAYVVETGNKSKLFFDTQTSLLARIETPMPDGSGVSATDLQDSKEVDGVQIPFTYKQDNPQMSLVIKFTECKQNVPIEDAKFSKPVEQTTQPAPAPAK